MSSNGESVAGPMIFESVLQVDVPKGRDGKHKEIITQLLSGIAQLDLGAALKVAFVSASGHEGEHSICSEPGRASAEDQSGHVEQ